MTQFVGAALAFALLVPLPARSQKDKDADAVKLELAATKAALAKSEAARVAAVTEQHKTTTALAALEATNKAAAMTANQNAAGAQFAADNQASLTRAAAVAAIAASQAAEKAALGQAAQAKLTTDQLHSNSLTAAITTIGSVLVSIFGFLYLDRKARLEHEWAQEAQHSQSKKLDGIHVLVNSNLTEAKQNQLVNMEANYSANGALFAVMRTHGEEPTADALESHRLLKARIEQLRGEIHDRLQATEVADAKL